MMNESLTRYIPIADAIAQLFHPHVEVVIHDIEGDSIAYIANPYSDRKKGDASLLGPFERDAQGFPFGADVEGPYENAGNRGQRIRSISAALKDNGGRVVGIMCTNVDFSKMEASLEIIENFLRPANLEAPPKVLFQNDWKDNIKLEIRTFLKDNDIRFDQIDAALRKKLIKRLEGKRLFYARKSVEQLATILGISRATVYKDLKIIRRSNRGGIQVVG